MDDRELLVLAAKAVGMKPRDQWAYDDDWGLKVSVGPPPYEWWNPLNDDGDALTLFVQLRLGDVLDTVDTNDSVAVRRAITRAAAAIGEQKGKG